MRGGLMAADRPYPPLRGLTVCGVDSGCLESGRAQGETIPQPLTGWGGRGYCRRSTRPEGQRPVPGSLSVTGHQSGPGPGRTAPGRPPQRAKLSDMRQHPSIKAAVKIWRCERYEPFPTPSLYSRSDKPRPERDCPLPPRRKRQALSFLSAYPSRQARRAAS